MNPIFAPEEPLAEPLEEIVLELSDFQRAHIVIAVVESEILLHEAMAELGQRLSGRCTLREFDFRCPPHKSLPRFCRSLSQQYPFCIFAYGLEKSQKKTQVKGKQTGKKVESTYNEALAFMNMHREDIALSKAAVVLWVPPVVHADLLSKAGDFWAWRTAEVRFEPSPGTAIRPTTLGKLSLEDAEDLRRQALQIEDILNRPHRPNPAVMAELQRQLGALRKQLGQEEESEALQAQATLMLTTLGDENRLKELYCQRLIAAHEYLDFRGILQMREILRLRLEDLYVPLSATTEATQRIISRLSAAEAHERGHTVVEDPLLHELSQTEYVTERRVEVAKALQDHPRLVVLGDPGTGKSTFLKLLALTFARGKEFVQEKFGLTEDRIPILVPVAAYGETVAKDMEESRSASQGLSFADFLFQRLEKEGLPADVVQRVLEQGKGLLLLDGLDEVLDLNVRIAVSRQIERFISECNSRNRIIVTSRIAGYQRVGFTSDFVHFTLSPFGNKEISAFVWNWSEAYEQGVEPRDSKPRAEKRTEQLTDAILSTPAIQNLAANPLLITILALIHQQGTRLPSQRVELYRLCVEALAEHWQRVRSLYLPIDLYLGKRRLDEPYVVGTLAPIVLWLFKNRPTGLLHRTELEKHIADQLIEQEDVKETDAPSLARQFVDLIREQSGLLVERGPDVFDFLHPTFKEYLAARQLAVRRNPLEVIGPHLFAARWREVILLTAGILKGDHLDDFIQRILDSGVKQYDEVLYRPLFLAARCLADDVQVSARLRKEIRTQLFTLWHQPPFAPLRDEITQTFSLLAGNAVIGSEILDFLLNIMQDRAEDAETREKAAWALGRLGEPAATEAVLTALVAYLKDTDSDVRLSAASALGELGEPAATEAVLAALIVCLKDTDSNVRLSAASALGELGEPAATEAVLAALIVCLKDTDSNVRLSAASALGELGERVAPKAVLTTLVTCLKDKDSDVRFNAASALGRLGEPAATEAVLTTLVTCLKDKDSDIRFNAALALGQLGKPAITTTIAARLIEFWKPHLQDTNYRLFIDERRRSCDFAYEEIQKLAEQPIYDQAV